MNNFVAKVEDFNGSEARPAKADKNGLMPVILDVKSGKCPNARVISGTVAQRMGIVTGETWFFTFDEGKADEVYGRRFTFSPEMQILDPVTFINTNKALGVANVFDVNAPVQEEVTAPEEMAEIAD